METIKAIEQRRSIRKFMPDPVSEEIILKILRAGMLAPSAKNRQPWRFVVVRGEKKKQMTDIFEAGIEEFIKRDDIPEILKQNMKYTKYSVWVMRQAPVAVFVINEDGVLPEPVKGGTQGVMELTDLQSVGACIENMLLSAWDLGIGSLWICDILFAYDQLRDWLGTHGQLVAAVSLGYADETPPARPRKEPDSLITWLD